MAGILNNYFMSTVVPLVPSLFVARLHVVIDLESVECRYVGYSIGAEALLGIYIPVQLSRVLAVGFLPEDRAASLLAHEESTRLIYAPKQFALRFPFEVCLRLDFQLSRFYRMVGLH